MGLLDSLPKEELKDFLPDQVIKDQPTNTGDNSPLRENRSLSPKSLTAQYANEKKVLASLGQKLSFQNL